ncbi:uncharacterized protein LOC114579332 [Dendrobium catenatum]|uniref:uncharacterized protein LOC114579332 n=1 Tax=Dendrobium catenatum TaxID=906689 RepID=UPI00109F59DF|nr:uncharacterized protein LOC114579332 [Dendrobium catenatum]
MASPRLRSNGIASIMREDGSVVTEQVEVANTFYQFFAQKWKGTDIVDQGWPSLTCYRDSIIRFTGILESDVSEEEILSATKSLGQNKAPGRDGITASFFKSYWDIVGEQVDMEQAYDKMSWQTLELVMERMGFSASFQIGLMRSVVFAKGRVSAVTIPVYPLLEIAVCPFQTKLQRDGSSDQPGGTPVSHLLYAVDILFFTGATMINARTTMSILTDYCSWTGQRVNRSKSTVLFSRWTPTATKTRMTRILGCCKVTKLDYLGLKLAMRRLTKVDFALLIQRAREHTLNWGIRHLSMAGRITLINYVLLPSSVFLMTHTIIPKAVLNDMERLCRSFLRDRDSEHKGMHYVAWEKVARPRRNGGLGFHVCARWTGALRARVAWNIIGNPEGLLQRCLKHKYGDELRDLNPPRGHSSNSIDRAISLWPTFCDISAIENLRVSDFLREGGSWDLPKLRSCFGELLMDNITTIPIGEGTGKDCMELIKTALDSTISAIV